MTADPSSSNDQDHGGTPGWVKVLGIGAVLLVLLLIVLMLVLGPDGHGPGRHLPFGSGSGELPHSSIVAHEGRTEGVGPGLGEDRYR